MIGVLLGILTLIISLSLAFFVSVSHVQGVVEHDFRNRVKGNGMTHSMSWGQLEVRARTLWDKTTSKKIDAGYVRKSKEQSFSNVSFTINLKDDNTSLTSEISINK